MTYRGDQNLTSKLLRKNVKHADFRNVFRNCSFNIQYIEMNETLLFSDVNFFPFLIALSGIPVFLHESSCY